MSGIHTYIHTDRCSLPHTYAHQSFSWSTRVEMLKDSPHTIIVPVMWALETVTMIKKNAQLNLVQRAGVVECDVF